MMLSTRLTKLTLIVLCCSAPLAAQRASSTGFFLASGDFGALGKTSSTKHVLTASSSSGVVANETKSTTYALVGGFFASLDTPVLGKPWVTAVRPLRVARNSNAALTVHGSELHLGVRATIKIAGRDAPVTARQRDRVSTTLPRDVAPGWQTVTVNAGGTESSKSSAVAILPMVETERPPLPGLPFEISFRGTQGDAVVWLLAAGELPFRVTIAPYGYGFGLDLGTLLVLGVTPVTDATGRFVLPLPGVPWSRPLHVQALTLSSSHYGPGTFTNVIGL